MEPDPVDYFPLPSGNLVSPVPSEYSDFTRLFLCFPSDCLVWPYIPSVFLQTNKNNKNTLTATTIVKIRSPFIKKILGGVKTARYIWTRAGKAFSRPDLNQVTLNSVVGLGPNEQHVKDGGIYWQFFQQWNRKRFVLFGLWYWWLSHSKSTWKAKQICTGGGK